MALNVKDVAGGAVLAVKVVPGSSRTRIAGVLDEALKVNVAAPPEKGKANKELEKFLAKTAGVPRSAVKVVSGLGNAYKELEFASMSASELRGILLSYLRQK